MEKPTEIEVVTYPVKDDKQTLRQEKENKVDQTVEEGYQKHYLKQGSTQQEDDIEAKGMHICLI